MSFSALDSSTLDRLSDTLDGQLARPGDGDWDAARQAWQLAVDQQPVAVAHAASVRDVVAVVDTARALGLRVAPQATGHNAAPLSPLGGTILLKTSLLRSVQIDAAAHRARAQAGALWCDVIGPAGEAGLATLAGTAPKVGVVGYTLGGGLSWLSRKYGLAANGVLAIELVTADGRHHRVDGECEPDLFWALRGGGGSFGVVTALEFSLFPISEVYAGALFWPIDAAHEVLHTWRQWTATVPEEVTSVGRLLRFPPLPDLPEHLRGRSFAAIEAACLTYDERAAAELLAPLRALHPAMDTFGPTPVTELGALHMDPDGPVPAFGDGMLVGALPAAGIDAFLAVVGPGSDSPLLSAELRHLGGALEPGPAKYGAVSALDGAFAMFGVGITPDAGSAAAVRRSVEALYAAMVPWSAGRSYLNFAERPKAGPALFGADTYRRLCEIKAAYDPTDLIRANHPVPPVG
ncbi:MAG: FAD-binding oxidoreductase [Pseudonocardiaceae bacterium]